VIRHPLSELVRPGDVVAVLRPDGKNPHAVRQFAKILKEALRIHGLRCVDVREINLKSSNTDRISDEAHRDPA
jgi:hypothetical protein